MKHVAKEPYAELLEQAGELIVDGRLIIAGETPPDGPGVQVPDTTEKEGE